MTDSVKANNGGSRLLGKLLLPGFTDAGANTSFQPTTAIGPASDAATEIRDNRSTVKQQFRMNSSRSQQASTVRQESSDSSVASSTVMPPPSQTSYHESRKTAFFPSTKPQRSPTPTSPPEVTREQIPIAASVAGTSVVPEIGAFPFSKADTNRPAGGPMSSIEKENQKRVYYWQSEGSQSSSSKKNMTLNAANLRRVEDSRKSCSQSPTDSSSSAPNRKASSVHNDDTGSDVMSTASEMGTVIEVGNRAARMAEIDALAALLESSPNLDTLTPRPRDFPQPPSQTPNSRSATDTIADLAMPTLDSLSRPVKALAPQSGTVDGLELGSGADPFHEHERKGTQTSSLPTPTEMLTSALRRLGTGLSKTKASLSAPPTPRSPEVPLAPRVEDLLRSSLSANPRINMELDNLTSEKIDLPASLALRSPGSTARLSLRRQRRDAPVLAPRFSPHHENAGLLQTATSYDSSAHLRTATVKSLPSSVPTLSTPLRLNHVSPFRLAQHCLSYDSTLDELEEIGSATGSATGSASSSHVLNLESYAMRKRTQYQPRTGRIQESMSWDVSSTSTAFRSEPHRSYRVGGLKATASQIELNAQRLRIHSDFSPRRAGSEGVHGAISSGLEDQRNVLRLRTPERFNVDVEREDALDILACLVERGVAAWSEEPAAIPNPNDSSESVSQTREALVSAVVKNLRTVAEEDPDGAAGETAAEQVDALEELLKAHSYALEMKRVSLSASSWLRSIGRGPLSNERYLWNSDGTKLPQEESERVGQASGEGAGSDEAFDSAGSTESELAAAKLEMLTLKARLHSAENELKEKTIMNQRLDEELSKCRAEIGRLRTAATKNESKSMIDDDGDTEGTDRSIEETETRADASTRDAQSGIEQGHKLFDESFQGDNSLFQDVSTSNLPEEESRSQRNLDLVVLKTALDQANDTIRLLHEKLQHEAPKEQRDETPIVDLLGGKGSSGHAKKSHEMTASVDSSEDRQTINVRMLNGENFVTEWGNLTTPLPPPPDHGLRSPIIDAVLEQWTDDIGLHDSLLTWMERVMTGDNLEETVPPLTISSLDHQVRDGFVMHLLPLLLRRADIHVSVLTRAHRTTTYDLAVAVNQSRSTRHVERQTSLRSPSLLDQQNSDEQDPPGGSQSVGGACHGDEDTEYTHFRTTSEDMDDGVQPTFMGALGDALGGFLSRGRNNPVHSPARSQTSTSAPVSLQPGAQLIMPTASSGGTSQGPSNSNSSSRVELDNQPYHRVVSAPPGRIGITFVEYRGHAMVADMAVDSPLSSWIFPSDILIAVDEVPVSGMRIREIIKILTNRKDRQRALRVISSHAMNEFTMNQSASVDVAP